MNAGVGSKTSPMKETFILFSGDIVPHGSSQGSGTAVWKFPLMVSDTSLIHLGCIPFVATQKWRISQDIIPGSTLFISSINSDIQLFG